MGNFLWGLPNFLSDLGSGSGVGMDTVRAHQWLLLIFSSSGRTASSISRAITMRWLLLDILYSLLSIGTLQHLHFRNNPSSSISTITWTVIIGVPLVFVGGMESRDATAVRPPVHKKVLRSAPLLKRRLGIDSARIYDWRNWLSFSGDQETYAQFGLGLQLNPRKSKKLGSSGSSTP